MTNPLISAILSIGEINQREEERKGSRISSFYTLILFGLVVAALMISLLFATTVYGAVNGERVRADENRAALNIISNSIRQADSSEFVTSKMGPEGSALVLVEHTKNGDYETRFYLSNGRLMQEYSREGASFNPDDAVEIAEIGNLSFEFDESLVTVKTDKGQIDVAIRSQFSDDDEDGDEEGTDIIGEGETYGI